MVGRNVLSFLCGVWHLAGVCERPEQTVVVEPPIPRDELGFDLLFSTNRDEMLEVPIHFENPVPRWLKGSLIRNGLGVFENGERTFKHTFDAFSKLSSWRFTGNQEAYFSTRLLRSAFYEESMNTNTIAPYLMLETVVPPFNQIDKFQALLRGIDNMNINVYRFKDEYVVLSDFWKLYKIYPQNLTTGDPVSNPPINSEDRPRNLHLNFLNLMSTSHPLPYPGTDHYVSFLSSVSLWPWESNAMNLIKIKSAEDREIIARWEMDRVPYMHSFSVTQHYAILFAFPFYVNVARMALKAEPFRCLDWYPDKPTTVYVVNMQTGQVHNLTTGNLFTMHHVNAYEVSPEHLVVDVSAYTGPEFVYNFETHIIRDPVARNKFSPHARIQRYDIFLNNSTIRMRQIPGAPEAPFTAFMDMPTINEKFRSKPYCITYGIVMKRDNVSLATNALVKKNICNRLEDKVWFVPNHYPDEAWFVPNPQGSQEDDGFLLVPILDGSRNQTYLAIIDARTLDIVNRAYLPTAIPFSFHGRFFPELK